MRADEVREAFLRYFEGQGHTRVPSASLIPAGDPTLLFTNAGMVQFKDAFLGLERRSYRRATTVQKCMRVSGKHNDLENVGPSPRHHTFFEMLGNFSFGDYFKHDAARFAWELTTGDLRIPADRLVPTVLEGDDEAAAAWAALGVPRERIVAMGEATNFWMMGDVGPCGPTSELHYDWGPAACTCGRPDCGVALDNGCGRWLEFWNLVFMQFDQAADGTRTPLPQPGVDTGMGLERIVSIIQGVRSNYDTDLFLPLLDGIQRLLAHTDAERAAQAVAYRVLADHGRAMTFLVADGVVPDNEGRGYVLRMIMRRAIRFARRAGASGSFLGGLADLVIATMRGAYPELVGHAPFIREALTAEEDRFQQTLDAGLGRLDDLIADTRRRGAAVLPGAEVFRLYDTYGFPPDLTRDVAREQGIEIDEAGFTAERARQQERSRASPAFQSDGTERAAYAALRDGGAASEFLGYDALGAAGRVLALLRAGARVPAAGAGEAVEVVCDRTPFYPESGGQVGDAGEIRTPRGVVEVTDTQRPVPGLVVHHGRVVRGEVKEGETAELRVDARRRHDIMRNHTATHLLHRALREILGEHARQAGSLVAPDRLRFDFLHLRPVSPAERERVEARVNEQVLAALPVRTDVMAYREAVATGAMALFNEKYGDRVRVVSIDGYSRELCGGTHVGTTAEIGLFLIASESSVGSGVRRIEALTGRAAAARAHGDQEMLRAAAEALRVAVPEVPERVRHLIDRVRTLEHEAQSTHARATVPDLETLVRDAPQVQGVAVVGLASRGADQAALRSLGDRVKARLRAGVVVAASAGADRVDVVVMATPDAVARGAQAGRVMAVLNRRLGTRGGGRPELAQGGGGDPAALDAVMADLPAVVREALVAGG
ncbi:MAG TPA: alanine--tRNA ligase [bacterium]|nr:alanine--tRNA ligase [bacterium]